VTGKKMPIASEGKPARQSVGDQPKRSNEGDFHQKRERGFYSGHGGGETLDVGSQTRMTRHPCITWVKPAGGRRGEKNPKGGTERTKVQIKNRKALDRGVRDGHRRNSQFSYQLEKGETGEGKKAHPSVLRRSERGIDRSAPGA